MPDKIGFLAGLGFIAYVFLLFSGYLQEDTTRTQWIVIGGLLFGLGVIMILLAARNWLRWKRILKADRSAGQSWPS